MPDEDVLAQAASTTQGMLPQQPDKMTSFGAQPLVQPPPMPQVQMPQQQFAKAGNEFGTVSGRKRADRQALFSNTANLVKSGSDYVQAKKQRDLTMTIERLISAQQGMEEAKQSGDQQAMQRNAHIINDITSDPKRLKQLQKAFSIDLFGGGKNKNENQALQEAWKNTSNKKENPGGLNPAAQKLMNNLPMRQQITRELQAQAWGIKEGLLLKPADVAKVHAEVFKSMMTEKTAKTKGDYDLLVEAQKLQRSIKTEDDKAAAQTKLENLRNENLMKVEKVKSDTALQVARIRASAVRASRDKLSPIQVEKMHEGIGQLTAAKTKLDDLSKYTGIYSDMYKAGRIKFVNDGITHRIVAQFVPATDEEKLAASAWGQSAEYMNVFRAQLAAQGFRSIPAYDNMLALRGQLWQDEKTMRKTLTDSSAFLNKMITIKKNALKGDYTESDAEAESVLTEDENNNDPGNLFPK